MQAKDYIFYTMMSALGSYYLYFIGKFLIIRNQLKEQYPECMSESYTYQASIFVITWILVSVTKKVVLFISSDLLDRALDEKRFPVGSE